MLGIRHPRWTHVWTVASSETRSHDHPIVADGIHVVSTGFILGEDQPMGLEATSLELLARHLIKNVAWPDLDYLLVDLPAGTSALQHVLARHLGITAALLVLTPQRVAHLDTRKVVQLYRHLRVPILGAVENMAYLRCPHCDEEIALFAPVDEAEGVWAMGLERLARVPFGSIEAQRRSFEELAAAVVARIGKL
jgi:ATP-binding protein involved in chromosome partitioning